MEKLTCLLLAVAVVLALSTTAFAEDLPSKTTSDLTQFEVVAENQAGDENLFLAPVNEATVENASEDFKKQVEACQKEQEKMIQMEAPVTYFGEIVDKDGKTLDIKTILGLEDEKQANVFEFCPVVAGGFEENCGKVTANMLFPTPYERGQKVVVMIGIITILEDGTQSVEWIAFEGEGMGAQEAGQEVYGRIQVELSPEIVNAIQEEMALVAIISA